LGPPPSRGFAGLTGPGSNAQADFEVDYFLLKAAGLPKIKVAPKGGLARPVFDAFGVADTGALELRLSGFPNAVYTIATSHDLSTWTPWLTVTNATSLHPIKNPGAASAGPRFYPAVAL